MDAQVIAGLNSLNTSIQNAAQLASAAGDSKRAEQMHWEDIKWTDKWRNEDKDFARETNRQAYEWSKEFANMDYEHQKEFIEMAQRYNSPLEQVKMLRDAGLNPALAFGDHSSIGVGGSGSHSSPSSSMPSSLGMPSQSGYFRAPNLGDPAQSFAAIASAYQAISESRKSDVETTQLENSAEALLRKITAEAEFAEIGVVLENEFGRGDRSRSQQLADQKIAETVVSIKNLAKQGDFIEAETAVQRVEKLIKDNELDRGNVELQYLPEQLRATIQGIKATAYRDSTQGELNKKLVVTEDETRDIKKRLCLIKLRRLILLLKSLLIWLRSTLVRLQCCQMRCMTLKLKGCISNRFAKTLSLRSLKTLGLVVFSVCLECPLLSLALLLLRLPLLSNFTIFYIGACPWDMLLCLLNKVNKLQLHHTG